MKIIRLEAENFKRLKAVEITPDGNLVVISGKNGAGKSSVLDAITAALGGTSSKTTPRPIRDGEDKAQIVLDLDDIVVTRTFSAGSTKLTVKGKDGATFGKGQAKLDDLIGKLSLDPLAFTQLSDRDQLKTLLGLVELPFDPAALEAERAALFSQRTDVNRKVKELQAQVAGAPEVPQDTPDEEVSVSALLTEYRSAQDLNNRIEEAHLAAEGASNRAAQLRAELAEAEQSAADAQKKADNAPAPADVDAIQSQIDNAETINTNVRGLRRSKEITDALTVAQQEAVGLTDGLSEIDEQKADGLAAASFPVEGLGFDEEGVTYRGIPFKQASSAEQLRVSLAMAMALHPSLRVIRIADGSLLDSENLTLIEEMAVSQDYQVWLEMVSELDDFGVVIEDGQVAS